MKPTNQRPVEDVIADYYRFLKDRDQSGLRSILSDKITVTYHAQSSQFPWAGKFHGIDGFDQFFTLIKTYLNVVDVEIIHSTVGKDKIVNQCAGIWEYKDSGYVVKGSMVNIFSVDNGLITGYDVYADTAAFAAGFPT